MIRIIGPEGTAEYRAACALRDLIIAAWPGVDAEELADIRLVAGAKCYGQTTTDIDLVVFVLLAKPRPIPRATPDEAPIVVRSLCLTIELKEHPRDKVTFDGNQATVQYRNRSHSATAQAHKQQAALRDFYAQHELKPPFITEFVWLPNVPQHCLPEIMSNLIGEQATWGDFLRRVVALGRPRATFVGGVQEIDAFARANPTQVAQIVDLLSKRLAMSALDRLKIERISRNRARQSETTKYMEKMGQQLLIFQGRGGTGKTVRLLQLAYDLYTERDARVLILTYNKVLVADLQRLFALIGAGSDDTSRTIVFKTVHAFLYQIVRHLGIVDAQPKQFLLQLEQNKQHVLKHLRKVRAQQQDPLAALIAAAPQHFDWDYIFIDEAQDWPTDERDLLFLLYDFRRFVLADGIDQMVRGQQRTHWRDLLAKGQSQTVTLHKSLRLKAGLCQFALAVARQLDLPDWSLEPDKEMYGGRVIILEGLYADDRSFHDQLMQLTRQANNHPIDTLFCVPPSLVDRRDREHVHSYVANRFQKWAYTVWDGTDKAVRANYPTSLEQIRVVQYDSCRGLEAWMGVNLGFDELYDYKQRQYTPPAQTTFAFRDDVREAHLFAARWLMIPLTRAIDTLVIQIRSRDHYIGQVLQAVAQAYPDLVEWHTVPAPTVR